MNWKLLWEAVKEPLRLLVLAVIPFVLNYLQVLPFQWAIILIVVLRFIDKWLHEYGKIMGDETLLKGLTQF